MTTAHKPHEAPAGTIEAQLIVIIGGKLMVNDTKTLPNGCYSLDVTLTPKDCCAPAAEAPAILAAAGVEPADLPDAAKAVLALSKSEIRWAIENAAYLLAPEGATK